MHYLFEQDHEIDLVLSRVFADFEGGMALPEAESIIKSMALRFIRRGSPLGLFHRNFLTRKFSLDERAKVDNDGPG